MARGIPVGLNSLERLGSLDPVLSETACCFGMFQCCLMIYDICDMSWKMSEIRTECQVMNLAMV